MGNVDLEVAQVLEDAATLYEDEKIEWCKGGWVKNHVRLNLDTEEVVPTLSMCAEGALMAAAGLTNGTIAFYQDRQDERDLVDADREASRRFAQARAVVTVAVGAPIPLWNDSISNGGGKQKVIDTFREVAKDIRNTAPAEAL